MSTAAGLGALLGILAQPIASLQSCGGLREGLLLCCNLDIDFLVVEVDAQAVVEIFKNVSYVNNAISPLLVDCRHLAARFQHIRFNHCY